MKLKNLFRSRHSKLLLIAFGFGAVLTFIQQNFHMRIFEAYFYDLRMRNKGDHRMVDHTVIVKIDDKTIERLNEFSPLSMKHHLELLKALGQTNPKAIAYFIDFN